LTYLSRKKTGNFSFTSSIHLEKAIPIFTLVLNLPDTFHFKYIFHALSWQQGLHYEVPCSAAFKAPLNDLLGRFRWFQSASNRSATSL